MKEKLQKILQDKFGLESFRDRQEEVIQSVVEWNDTIVFMPTGWWKSLTYQLPGIYLDGVTLVISPLISLMKDQVDKLNELWIKTELINSTIDTYDIQIILNELSKPNTDIKFLYIAPERLNSQEFIRVISRIKIALVAIDEAHCISQWWHDFRPSYMKIRGFLDSLKNNPPIPNPFPPREKGDSSFVENTRDYITRLSQDLRKNLTDTEKVLWEILRNKQLAWFKFRRQHPFWRYVADFYSDEAKIVIELDWNIHENQKEYDEIRDEIISKYGVEILRIKNEEITNNLENVINKIVLLLSPLGGKVGIGGQHWETHSFPIMALTATATKKVRIDIVERLWLKNHNIFTSWFDRKNITLIVREISKKEEKMQKVAEIIAKTPGVWIIYCASRKAVSEVYDDLINNWIKAWIYTGALNSQNREKEQNDFMNDWYKVIVATNAFGMWIDKKDIRFVIHYNLPGSIENYYQEVWRAWRDGKQSYWIVIASFQDTKIQEFFIENTYPSKQEILTLYDYLYKLEKEWHGKWQTILKTYFTIATESGISNDMKVWSALRVLEKYWIIKRWVDSNFQDEWFRWRWLTLFQEKRSHSHLLIDWAHQDLLKEEAYFKLDQIKKLLFYPSCRKKFILNYFWDDEDLATLWDNCGACDYCIEKKKFANTEVENFVNLSVFALVLDVVKNTDAKIWVVMMTKFLWWSKDKKIIEWNMDKRENFWALEDLTSELIQAVIEALISLDYLYKTEWKYPLLWITDAWKVAIIRANFLKDDNRELQHYIKMKIWPSLSKSKKITRTSKSLVSTWIWKINTYSKTLKLYKSWISLKEISEKREMTSQTIESHIVKLYEQWDLSLPELMKLVSFSNLKSVKEVINTKLSGITEPLKPIKDELIKQGKKDISYFDIKVAIAMIGNKDL